MFKRDWIFETNVTEPLAVIASESSSFKFGYERLM